MEESLKRADKLSITITILNLGLTALQSLYRLQRKYLTNGKLLIHTG
jgi:hypothetical protein